MCRKCAKYDRFAKVFSVLILSIDCAGSSCAVCVWQDGRVLAHAREIMQRGQDTRLMPMILLAVARANLVFSQFDRIAVTRGPGSFTGLRVGIAAARGIGMAAGKPVFGIDRFAIYHALHASKGKDLLIIIDSKRAEFFCRFFPAESDIHEPTLMTQPQIDAFIAAHQDIFIAGDIATPGDDITTTCAMLAAQVAVEKANTKPLYLRAPDVTLPDGTPGSAISR
jgi:tRNA threonylcarbamoyladenosine biosynthesis protein TsaB